MASKQNVSIFWFRQDLRVHDNPGLTSALSLGNVLPIYILDDINSNQHRMGAASRWWLHNSLKNLNKRLENKISFYLGDPLKILGDLIKKFEIKNVFWNRCYEPWRIERDTQIKSYFNKKNINVETFNSSLLW